MLQRYRLISNIALGCAKRVWYYVLVMSTSNIPRVQGPQSRLLMASAKHMRVHGID